jgi:hypothetical protein
MTVEGRVGPIAAMMGIDAKDDWWDFPPVRGFRIASDESQDARGRNLAAPGATSDAYRTRAATFYISHSASIAVSGDAVSRGGQRVWLFTTSSPIQSAPSRQGPEICSTDESKSPPIPRHCSDIFGEFVVSFTFTQLTTPQLSH